MGQYAEDDEDPILPGPDSGYLLIVQDDHESAAYWHEAWGRLEHLKRSLVFFQETHEPPDWDILLKDLQTLQPLRSGGRHPLNDYRDFDLWPFFMHLAHRTLLGTVDHVYFDESTPKKEVNAFLDECSILLRRLRDYGPLRRFSEDMPQ